MAADKPEGNTWVSSSVTDKAVPLYVLCEFSAFDSKPDKACSVTLCQEPNHLVFVWVPDRKYVQDLANIPLKSQSYRRALSLEQSSCEFSGPSLHVPCKLTAGLPN